MFRRLLPATILVTSVLLATSCVRPVVVEGCAMSPTLRDGDRWLITASIADLRRGDIIELRYPKDPTKLYIKRIVGLPGERLEMRDNKVLINGVEFKEDYLDQTYNQSGLWIPEKLIPPDHYFVLGDNRDNSSDSRYWGTVDKSLVVGKLYMRYASGEKK